MLAIKINRIPQSWTKMNVISEFMPLAVFSLWVKMWWLTLKSLLTFTKKNKQTPTARMHFHSFSFLKSLPEISRKCKQGRPFGFLSPLIKKKLIFDLLFGAKEQAAFFFQTDLKGVCLISGSLCSWWDMFERFSYLNGTLKRQFISLWFAILLFYSIRMSFNTWWMGITF